MEYTEYTRMGYWIEIIFNYLNQYLELKYKAQQTAELQLHRYNLIKIVLEPSNPPYQHI